MKRVSSILLASMLVFLMVLIGCGKKNDEAKVRIGYFPNITHAQALIGFSDGTFQKHFGNKIKLEEKIFNAGPAEIEAILAGELDLGYIGPFPAMNGYHKSGGAIKILAGATNGGAVMVSRDKSISEFSQFKGKKIAVPQFGNTQDIVLRKIMLDYGLKATNDGGDVTVVQVENPDILTLFRQGTLDGALVPEPWGSRLVKDAGANVVLDWNELWAKGNYPVAVVIVRTEFLKEHPDLVQKFVDAHMELSDRFARNPGAYLGVMNVQIKNLTGKKLPEDVLGEALKRISTSTELSAGILEQMADIAIETGYMKQKPDIGKAIEKIN